MIWFIVIVVIALLLIGGLVWWFERQGKIGAHRAKAKHPAFTHAEAAGELVEGPYTGPVGEAPHGTFVWHVGDPPPLERPLNSVVIAELPPGAAVVHSVQLDDQDRFIIKRWAYQPPRTNPVDPDDL